MIKTNMAEFIENGLKAEVIDMHNPSCRFCNDCCSMGSMLLPEEFISLKKYLTRDKTGKRIFKEALRRIYKYTKQGDIYWMCPFSNSNRKCSIYSIRPQICREFHCTPELNKLDKNNYSEEYTIFHLFKDHYKINIK